jgi:hypothetical protein
VRKSQNIIETALDRVLTELIELRASVQARPQTFMLSEQIMDASVSTMSRSDAEALAHDPLQSSLKQAIRTLGQALYAEVQTIEEMRDFAERVCGLDEVNAGKRIAVVDSAWHGIGRGDDRWSNRPRMTTDAKRAGMVAMRKATFGAFTPRYRRDLAK